MSAVALPWYRRVLPALRSSLKLRLVLIFLLLAMGMAFTFISGAQKAFSVGWREAARPLFVDYVDRLAAELTVDGSPSTERARALVLRLPGTVDISGPVVNWRSHPEQAQPDWKRRRPQVSGDGPGWVDEHGWVPLLQRSTADGHRIEFGLNEAALVRRPKVIGYALAVLLTLTLLAYLYVRHLLRPLDDIGRGAQRFGAGEFGEEIPVRRPLRPDELGQLATTINTMGRDIQQMLEAQRALLLAISHELRSPLTRARLHAELLPESGETQGQREALLRDLGEMARLISDLLESERLAGRHQVLHLETTDVAVLAREVIAELALSQPRAADIRLCAPVDLPLPMLDRVRLRLLLRNLLDNALRHSAEVALAPELHLEADATGLKLEVRDHGPGVPEEQIPQLAQPFFRPDAARSRSTGGVGLGLYLCRLVAQAHGGTFAVRNARPGLAVTVRLPAG